MRLIGKLGVVGLTGAAVAAVVGALPAEGQRVSAPAGAARVAGAVVSGQDPFLVLVGHALSMAITGTQTQLTARMLAVSPGRKEGEAENALKALRQSARTSYDDARKLLESARDQVAGLPEDSHAALMYRGANEYTRLLWALAGEAAPVDEPKDATPATGELSVEDVASIEVINGAVLEALDAFTLKELAVRLDPADDPAVAKLDGHSGAMATASKKSSDGFPGVPERKHAEAAKNLEHSVTQLDAAKATSKAAKELLKHKAADPDSKKAAKAAKEQAKTIKEEAGKEKESAEKAKRKAEEARKEEVGAGARPTVHELALRGRQIILMIHLSMGGPKEEAETKADEPKKIEKKASKIEKKEKSELKTTKKALKKSPE